MLGQMGIGVGRIGSSLITPLRNGANVDSNDSPFNQLQSQPQSQSRQVQSTRNITPQAASPASGNHHNINSSLPNTEADAMDIDQSVQVNKEFSLAYQIMRAIARLDSSVAGESVDTGEVSEFDLSYQFSFSSEQSSFMQASGTNGSVTETRMSGFQLDLSLDISMEISEEDNAVNFSMSFEFSQSQFSFESFSRQQEEQVDPLILNLNGSDFSFQQNLEIAFDLDANGGLDQFFAPGAGNFFLALDKNSNGFIDNGLELFGDAGGAKDGFEALRQFDFNQDNQIDSSDEVFSQLKLMSFTSSGNQSINSLSDLDVQSISLESKQASKAYFDNNKLIAESAFDYSNGSKGRVGDFLITVR